jgi:multidrug efflux pump
VQVQNKLQLAMPLLPQEVQRQGINVAKSSSGFLNVIAFVSETAAWTPTTSPTTSVPTSSTA